MEDGFMPVSYAHFSFRVYDESDSYPPVPLPMINATANGELLPHYSGVYFLWGGEFGGRRKVVYVGQAADLSSRVRLGAHHSLKEWHLVSYLLMAKGVTPYAEAYYISILRPSLNKANFFQPTKACTLKQAV